MIKPITILCLVSIGMTSLYDMACNRYLSLLDKFCVYNIECVQEQGTSDTIAKGINDELDKLSIRNKKDLIDNDWKIILSNKSLKDKFGESKTALKGVTLWDEKEIYIDNRDVCIKDATLHEVGHAIGIINSEVQNTDEFVQIFVKERDNIDDKYAKTNSDEYFATVFKMLIDNPNEAKEQLPETSKFIQQFM